MPADDAVSEEKAVAQGSGKPACNFVMLQIFVLIERVKGKVLPQVLDRVMPVSISVALSRVQTGPVFGSVSGQSMARSDRARNIFGLTPVHAQLQHPPFWHCQSVRLRCNVLVRWMATSNTPVISRACSNESSETETFNAVAMVQATCKLFLHHQSCHISRDTMKFAQNLEI